MAHVHLPPPSTAALAAPADTGDHGTYVPGRVLAKAAVLAAGLLLLAFAGGQIAHPLYLAIRGLPAEAEAVAVIKRRPGGPPVVLTDHAAAIAAEEKRDRSWAFVNAFRFQAADGREVRVELPVHGQLRPLYRLLDEDGLPTVLPIRYAPADPRQVCFPTVIGTWFVPGMLLLIGAITCVIGGVLLAYARRPIALPPPG